MGISKSEEFYRYMFVKLNEAVFVIEQNSGIIEFVNATGQTLLNVKNGKIIGKDITNFFFHKIEFKKFYKKCLTQLESKGESKTKLQLKRGKRDCFWAELNFSMIRSKSGVIKKVVLLIRDISLNIKLENNWSKIQEQLRGLTSHIQDVREEERMQIARELHDELSPVLTVLKMDLVNISSKIEVEQSEVDCASILRKMAKMEKRIDNTIDTLRRIITEIRPGILDDLGLIPAIEWLIGVFEKKSEIKFHFNSNVEDSYIGTSRDTAVFRIIQESLTNIIRHSQATEAMVKISVSKKYFELKISDDGIGIKDEKLLNNTSFGLIGMRERAETLGFEFSIKGIQNKGTIIQLKLPIEDL